MSHSKFSKEALQQIAERQHAWAEQREIDTDPNGMVSAIAENLFAPLSPETQAELERNRPEQIGDPGKAAELRRLDSSAALVCNFFDYWRGRDCQPMSEACGVEPNAPELRFAELLPVAPALSEETASPIDVLFTAPDAKPTAIVGGLGEPYQTRSERRAQGFAFFTRTGIWGPLEDCRKLALDRAANPGRYLRLDIGELLKQCLALSNRYGPRGFRLLHLWYDVPGHASLELRREIDRFRMRVGGEVDFESSSWQALFESFRAKCGQHVGYADYLAARYFDAQPTP